MSAAQDNAFAATAVADNLTNLANVSMSSTQHFQANQAHSMAAVAWSSVGTPTAKIAYHNNLSAVHLTTAIQLRTAGK